MRACDSRVNAIRIIRSGALYQVPSSELVKTLP